MQGIGGLGGQMVLAYRVVFSQLAFRLFAREQWVVESMFAYPCIFIDPCVFHDGSWDVFLWFPEHIKQCIISHSVLLIIFKGLIFGVESA